MVPRLGASQARRHLDLSRNPSTDQEPVFSDFIKQGEWGPGFYAQNEMLDEHAERYNLKDQDWRKGRSWYKPEK